MISEIGKYLYLGTGEHLDDPDVLKVVDVPIDIRSVFFEDPIEREKREAGEVPEWQIKWQRLDNLMSSMAMLIEDYNLKVLVYCHAGQDRSPFVVMCYLSKYGGYKPDDAYDFVKECRPEIRIHTDWLSEWRQRLSGSG